MRVEQVGEVAVLTLREGLGNAVTPRLVADLNTTVDQIRKDDPAALVVTGTGGMFSAGMAVPLLIDHSRAEMREFMVEFSGALRKLLTLPLPTVAAINGHAITSGCVLTLMCDRRIMVDEGARIGLTEVRMGMSLPSVITETLRLRLPASAAARIAMGGDRFRPEEALEIGLVDELVSRDDLLDHACEVAIGMVRPGTAYAQIKADLLAPTLQQMNDSEDRQMDGFIDTWFGDAAQEQLAEVLSQLK